MEDCLFCKIGKGEIGSKTIYENDSIIAFLDINPNAAGHTLVVPKKHITDLMDMDDETIKEVKNAAQVVYNILKEKLNFDGLRCVQNNGIIQEVKHYHLHMIPIYKENKELTVDEVFELLTK